MSTLRRISLAVFLSFPPSCSGLLKVHFKRPVSGTPNITQIFGLPPAWIGQTSREEQSEKIPERLLAIHLSPLKGGLQGESCALPEPAIPAAIKRSAASLTARFEKQVLQVDDR